MGTLDPDLSAERALQETAAARTGRPQALNLGCGKITFPAHLPPDKPEYAAYDWINVDRVRSLPDVQWHWDLFRYPWPVYDGAAQHIHLSHIAEHIPHESRLASAPWPPSWEQEAPDGLVPPDRQAYVDHLLTLDGFFAFFSEVYRVLVMGGTIYCETPYAYSHGAEQDPTHVRRIVPSTISYLCNQPSPQFDYELPMRFELTAPISYAIDPEFQGYVDNGLMTPQQVVALSARQMNVVHTLSWTMRKIPMEHPFLQPWTAGAAAAAAAGPSR